MRPQISGGAAGGPKRLAKQRIEAARRGGVQAVQEEAQRKREGVGRTLEAVVMHQRQVAEQLDAARAALPPLAQDARSGPPRVCDEFVIRMRVGPGIGFAGE